MVLGGNFATTFCLVTQVCSFTACPVLLGPRPFISVLCPASFTCLSSPCMVQLLRGSRG